MLGHRELRTRRVKLLHTLGRGGAPREPGAADAAVVVQVAADNGVRDGLSDLTGPGIGHSAFSVTVQGGLAGHVAHHVRAVGGVGRVGRYAGGGVATLGCVGMRVCVCVCVCEREREGESEGQGFEGLKGARGLEPG